MRKYTKEILSEIAQTSKSMAEVLRTLGLKEAGGNYCHIKRLLKQEKIDISHFVPYKKFLQPGINKKKWQDVLILRENGKRVSAIRLRRALLEAGVKYKCSKCEQNETWNNEILILEVNHKNNNWLDNRLDNVEFICPNCHSQERHSMNKGYTGITKMNSASW